MWKYFYEDNPFLHYPLFALFLFLTLFAGVLVWTFGVKRNAPRFDEASNLPLQGDESHG